MKLFFPGKVVATQGVSRLLGTDPTIDRQLIACLMRHLSGDWGDVPIEDKKTNDRAVTHGERILSAYRLAGERIWIITEWDRSVTTILLPEEY